MLVVSCICNVAVVVGCCLTGDSKLPSRLLSEISTDSPLIHAFSKFNDDTLKGELFGLNDGVAWEISKRGSLLSVGERSVPVFVVLASLAVVTILNTENPELELPKVRSNNLSDDANEDGPLSACNVSHPGSEMSNRDEMLNGDEVAEVEVSGMDSSSIEDVSVALPIAALLVEHGGCATVFIVNVCVDGVGGQGSKTGG